MTTRTRVLCIDDNRLIAEAMQRRLAFEPDVAWAGWVEHACDALAAALEAQPDIVMLDIDMPEHDAFELTRDLARRLPNAKVVMFSGHVRTEFIDRAVDAGAWGYLSKNESMAELLAAIRRVAAGEFVLSPDVTLEHGRHA